MNNPLWYLKQLLPLTYRSQYGEGGQERFCVWRMWLGRCFAIDDMAITGPIRHLPQ